LELEWVSALVPAWVFVCAELVWVFELELWWVVELELSWVVRLSLSLSWVVVSWEWAVTAMAALVVMLDLRNEPSLRSS
jgi:hypothetical protein